MSLIVDKTVNIFDVTVIGRGDCIRIKRVGDNNYKNGFVTQVDENQIQILYCNTQNSATSYITINAVDVAIGAWEVYWTRDFKTINCENSSSE